MDEIQDLDIGEVIFQRFGQVLGKGTILKLDQYSHRVPSQAREVVK
jgi:hypothetical protein